MLLFTSYSNKSKAVSIPKPVMALYRQVQRFFSRLFRRLQVIRDEVFVDEFGNRNYAFWTRRFWSGED